MGDNNILEITNEPVVKPTPKASRSFSTVAVAPVSFDIPTADDFVGIATAPKDDIPQNTTTPIETNTPVKKRASSIARKKQTQGDPTDKVTQMLKSCFAMKKAEELSAENIAEKAAAHSEQVITDLSAKLTELDESLVALYKAFAQRPAQPDERLTELIEAANDATDEGISVAITILQKFKK